MKTTRITPQLVQLTRLGLVNCYLVSESDGITLVDTGLPNSTEEILAAASSYNAPIKRIVLTHAHADHIGSLDALARALGTIDVAISRRDARLLHKDTTLDPTEPQTPVKGTFSGALTPPTHLLTDGELFGSLRAIATPGHTPGHMCFLDERDGSLLAGDAFAAVHELRVAGDAHWLFPLPNRGTWHPPTALASANGSPLCLSSASPAATARFAWAGCKRCRPPSITRPNASRPNCALTLHSDPCCPPERR